MFGALQLLNEGAALLAFNLADVPKHLVKPHSYPFALARFWFRPRHTSFITVL
jgi:hypothetical protein